MILGCKSNFIAMDGYEKWGVLSMVRFRIICQYNFIFKLRQFFSITCISRLLSFIIVMLFYINFHLSSLRYFIVRYLLLKVNIILFYIGIGKLVGMLS